MEDREFYKQFQRLKGEGFLVRSKKDINGSQGMAIVGLGMALVEY